MITALIGKVRLVRTRIQVRKDDGIAADIQPLTPEQATILVRDWSKVIDGELVADVRDATITIMPLLVDDKALGAIRISEADGPATFTLLLEPADFGIFTEQFNRTWAILDDETQTAGDAGAPPLGEGRRPPPPPFSKGDRNNGDDP